MSDSIGQLSLTKSLPGNVQSGLPPIIKWPGGKEKELKYILPNMPAFKRFIEPFVGGGAVFMGVDAKEYFINDFSSELIGLYKCISSSDEEFFRYVEAIDDSWINADIFFDRNRSLVDTYILFRNGEIDETGLKIAVNDFCNDRRQQICDIVSPDLRNLPSVLFEQLELNLTRKMIRMRQLERTKHLLPEKDLDTNILTAVKSALYMNFRQLYNDRDIASRSPELHCALFFFIRNYAYSGMFRYSSNGDFNVPYGGIAYNSKRLSRKLEYYRSAPLLDHFAKTKIFNMDFELFLEETCPQEDDFVFLDPPYDSEFSTYAGKDFTKSDQKRLADYMIDKCRAKWMMIIKNTDFIYNLYNREGINIRMFDKEYLVSFMNRNDKKVTHLLITNY